MTQVPTEPSPHTRRLLLVAGSGRSGTSLVTGLLGRLGWRIPLPEVTADDTNPRGFGEPQWAVDFHTDLLRRRNVATEDARPEAWELTAGLAEDERARTPLRGWLEEQFAAADAVVVKDPRVTWFLDLYSGVAADLGASVSVLTMVRHPAASLRSRELAYGSDTPTTTRAGNWVNMMLGIESASRRMPRALVAYDQLVADWTSALLGAERSLGTPLLTGTSPEQQRHAGDLVDASLRRATVDWTGLQLPDELRGLAERVHDALQQLTAGGPAAVPQAALDALRLRYDRVYEDASELTRARVRAARVAERRRIRREQREAEAALGTTGAAGAPARSR